MSSKQAKTQAAGAERKLQPHALLQITWEDAAFDLDKDPGTLQMVTVGYLIRQTQQVTVLAGEAGASMDYFRSYTAIPSSLIRSIKLLTPA